MSVKFFLLFALLAICANVWASEAVTPSVAVDAEKKDIPVITEVELPPAFLEAKPIPVIVTEQPAQPAVPAAEILPYEMEIGTSYGHLSNGYFDWSGTYVNAAMKLAERNSIYASLRQVSRFSKTDAEIMGGIYDPISEHLTAVVEVTVSETHRVLPSRSLFGQIDYAVAKAWSASVGLCRTEYNTVAVNLLTFTADHYWGDYRAVYTRYQSYLFGQGAANSNQVQVVKYFGDRDWFGMTVSEGVRIETLDTTQVLSNVRTLEISGHRWFKPRLALTYMMGNYRQNNIYTRNGIQLGLRSQF